MELKNKEVLITGGSTWAAIDSVRVIGNNATGETAILLAEQLSRLGAKPTLLLGPGQANNKLSNNIKLKRYVFFDELKNLLAAELRTKKYDLMIHSAAVSDYLPKTKFKGKIGSCKKFLNLKLTPAPKLINLIKEIDPAITLVGFKYEPNSPKSRLLGLANKLLKNSGADLVVANTSTQKGRYLAYILDRKKISTRAEGKKDLIRKLLSVIVKFRS